MPTQIEVQPETAARIAAYAQARGLSVDEFLRSLLERAETAAEPTPKRAQTAEEIKAFLDSLAEGSENRPSLPPEANSREYYYEERPDALSR